jgi:hypothetical protein
MNNNDFVLFHDLSVSDALENLANIVDVLAETAEQPYGITLMLWTIRDSLMDACKRIHEQPALSPE